MIVSLAILLVLLVAGGVFAYLYSQSNNRQNNGNGTQTPTPQPQKETVTRAIFAKEVAKEISGERELPVYELFVHDEGKNDISLGKFGGKDNEVSITEAKLSLKGDAVYVQTANKLIAVDIATKEQTDIWQAPSGNKVVTFIENTDATKLYVSASPYLVNGSSDKHTIIDEITLSDNSKKTFFGGQHDDIRFEAVRADGKIVITDITYSEMGRYSVFDPTTKSFTLATEIGGWTVSRDGTKVALPGNTANDPCSMTGKVATSLNVADPLTKAPIYSAQAPNGKHLLPLKLSNTGDKLLVSMYSITSGADCDPSYSEKPTYAVYSSASNPPTPVASIYEGHQQLFPDKPYLEAGEENKTCFLKLNDKSIATQTQCDNPSYFVAIGTKNIEVESQ